jgi:hypothetical protein
MTTRFGPSRIESDRRLGEVLIVAWTGQPEAHQRNGQGGTAGAVPEIVERADHLSMVRAELSEEFGARFDQKIIRIVAAEEIATFADSPVRDFIPILALRRGRARLQGVWMDIEEFYDANPVRRSSEEVEFGRDWSDAQGNRGEVSWIKDTGELYVMIAPVEPIVTDPVGDEFVQALPTEAVRVEALRVIPTLERVEEALTGWEAAMSQPRSLDWVQTHLADGQSGKPPTAPP